MVKVLWKIIIIIIIIIRPVADLGTCRPMSNPTKHAPLIETFMAKFH